MNYFQNNRVRVSVQPYAEPIDILEAKGFMDISPSDTSRDAQILSLIREARAAAEEFTQRRFVAQTLVVTVDKFGSGYNEVLLPTPLISVDAFSYVDLAGNTQTWASTNYEVDTVSEPGRLLPSVTLQAYWPQVLYGPNRGNITVKAGYLTPYTISGATLTVKGRTFAAQDRVRLSNSGGKLPMGFYTYTDYYVRDVSGSTFKLETSIGGGAITPTGQGTGTNFIGELSTQAERAKQAMCLRIAARFEYPEGGDNFDKAMKASNDMLFDAAVPQLVAA